VPHEEPFISADYTENHLLLSVLHDVMGGLQQDTVEIQTLSWVTSMPQSPHQNMHEDFGHLFPTNARTMKVLY
jgi:hypothetical protein